MLDHSPTGPCGGGSLKAASSDRTAGMGMRHILRLSNQMTVATAGQQCASWVHADSRGMDVTDLQLLAPHGGFLLGHRHGCLGHGDGVGRLEANGFSSPSALPFPFPPLVPFGVGSESRAQLLDKGGSDPPKVAPCLLTQ